MTERAAAAHQEPVLGHGAQKLGWWFVIGFLLIIHDMNIQYSPPRSPTKHEPGEGIRSPADGGMRFDEESMREHMSYDNVGVALFGMPAYFGTPIWMAYVAWRFSRARQSGVALRRRETTVAGLVVVLAGTVQILLRLTPLGQDYPLP